MPGKLIHRITDGTGNRVTSNILHFLLCWKMVSQRGRTTKKMQAVDSGRSRGGAPAHRSK